jgi:hypothetical protein
MSDSTACATSLPPAKPYNPDGYPMMANQTLNYDVNNRGTIQWHINARYEDSKGNVYRVMPHNGALQREGPRRKRMSKKDRLGVREARRVIDLVYKSRKEGTATPLIVIKQKRYERGCMVFSTLEGKQRLPYRVYREVPIESGELGLVTPTLEPRAFPKQVISTMARLAEEAVNHNSHVDRLLQAQMLASQALNEATSGITSTLAVCTREVAKTIAQEPITPQPSTSDAS